MQGKFYIVSTPIGNLQDISYRAVDVLKKVDYIACEDTRVTKILTENYSISTPLFDCHKFNEKEKSIKIIEKLKSGKNIALVSDAGTPNISDPGSVLLKELLKEKINITAIPGPCAITTFLSMIPRENEEFVFIGFIPREKKHQIDVLDKYKYTNCLFYDSPNRLLNTLQNILETFGENTRMAIARELTKIFEEVKIDSVKNIIDYYNKNPLKGEIVAMIFAQNIDFVSDDDLICKIEILKNEGYSQKDIVKIVSKLFGINKNRVYELALKLK